MSANSISTAKRWKNCGELSRDHLLLFLWSHKVAHGQFVFLLSLLRTSSAPLPLIFAGIKHEFSRFRQPGQVGAIFLRRTFQEDPIYKLVFRSYIDHLIRKQAAPCPGR